MITTEQLAAVGFRGNSITRSVAGGWLERRHIGVYQLGVFPGPYGDEAAALLACGAEAALTHWAGIAMFELAERRRPIDVSTPGRFPGRRPGIRPHRAVTLPPGDVVLRHGLRTTIPARTLVDLAAKATRAELERLVEEAQVQRVASTTELLAAVERGAGRPGVRKLRQLVLSLDEPLFTRSEAERRLIALCRSAALPMPRTNVKRAGWEVDAVWDRERLVVEVDGHRYHSTRPNFERDRRKDADLMLAGYRVLRITWRRLAQEPDQVIALIAAALSQVSLAPAQRERVTPR